METGPQNLGENRSSRYLPFMKKHAFCALVFALSGLSTCLGGTNGATNAPGIPEVGLGGNPVPDSGLNTNSTTIRGVIVENYLDDDLYYYTVKPLKPLSTTIDNKEVTVDEEIHIYNAGPLEKTLEEAKSGVGKEVDVSGIIRPKFDWNCLTRYVTMATNVVVVAPVKGNGD